MEITVPPAPTSTSNFFSSATARTPGLLIRALCWHRGKRNLPPLAQFSTLSEVGGAASMHVAR
jgi:hypothetical protein